MPQYKLSGEKMDFWRSVSLQMNWICLNYSIRIEEHCGWTFIRYRYVFLSVLIQESLKGLFGNHITLACSVSWVQFSSFCTNIWKQLKACCHLFLFICNDVSLDICEHYVELYCVAFPDSWVALIWFLFLRWNFQRSFALAWCYGVPSAVLEGQYGNIPYPA